MERRESPMMPAASPIVLAAQSPALFPMGINTYCLPALRRNDAQLPDYAKKILNPGICWRS